MEDEITNLIGYWDWENKTANQCAAAVLSLIDSQRCVWKQVHEFWFPACDNDSRLDAREYKIKSKPFCPYCGKRISIIEVKDGQG